MKIKIDKRIRLLAEICNGNAPQVKRKKASVQEQILDSLKEQDDDIAFNLYIVGGYIRNSLFGKKAKDIDLCGAGTLSVLENILAGTKYKLTIKNSKLGTATIKCGFKTYEYTTFRVEEYDDTRLGKHFPSRVIFTDILEKDALRRDFTINALYYDILNERLIDPAKGAADIKNKILKTVDIETLKHDGARIFRLARFAKMHELTVERKTLDMAKICQSNALEVSGELRSKEILKTKKIKCSKEYEPYFKKLLMDIGLTKFFNTLK